MSDKNALKKEMTLYGLIMVAIGASIGSGIFLTPSGVAKSLPDTNWIIGIWTLGGIISLTGALTYGELGAMFPKAGGVYVYIKNAFGEITGFLYGWVILFVITSGSIAALASAFTQYFKILLPWTQVIPDYAIGTLLITLLTLFNILGINIGQYISNLFTTTKIIGIFLIIIIGFCLGQFNTIGQPTVLPINTLAGGCAAALIGVLWSYGGWHHTASLAGETREAASKVPKAMIIGSIVVIVAYILVNIAYIKLLSLEGLLQSDHVATDALKNTLHSAPTIIALVIVISTFGTMSIYTMTAPRIYYAMADDGIFFKKFAEIHPKYKTPVFSILLQSAWSIVLLLFWKTFDPLITYVTFMDWIFLMLAAIALFVFRRRNTPNLSGYRVPLYPIVPLIFILISFWFILSTLMERPEQAIGGLVVLIVGLVLFYAVKYFNGSSQKQL